MRTKTLDFSVNILRAILWQYDNSPTLKSLLQAKQNDYDRNVIGFWQDWIRDVFDLRTANAFGLRVWSIILGVPLLVAQPQAIVTSRWGFGANRRNFNDGNFGNAGSGAIALTLEQQRLLLRLRYFQLTTRCTIPEINRILKLLFASAPGQLQQAYVTDGLDMTMQYVFAFPLDTNLSAALKRFDLLPRPSTVGFAQLTVATKVFGFGSNNVNFDNGAFQQD